MSGASQTIKTNCGIAKLRWTCSGIGGEMVASFGFEVNAQGLNQGANVNLQPDVCAQSWSDAWLGAFEAPTMSNAWTFVGVDISLWTADQVAGGTPVPPIVGTHDVNSQGSGNWACLPPNCALLVIKQSAIGGRVGKGRCYLPAGYLGESEVNAGGALSSAELSGANAKLGQLVTNLGDNAVGIGLRLFHGQRHHQGAVIAPAADPTEVTGLVADPRIGTQRRRMHR
jgi:hypothetical protein